MGAYPWWTRLPIVGRIYFAGWQRGEESGVERGFFQATGKYRPSVAAVETPKEGTTK
jgi:hypothetical protein